MTAGHEVALALRAAYLALHRRTNAWFATHGVTADQFVMLSALADADAVTQQELVRRVGSDPNTVRAMLLLNEQITDQEFGVRAGIGQGDRLAGTSG